MIRITEEMAKSGAEGRHFYHDTPITSYFKKNKQAKNMLTEIKIEHLFIDLEIE